MTTPRMIQAVIWDLGGVLLRTEDRSGRLAWEERLGLTPGELDSLVFYSPPGRRAAVGSADIGQVWDWVAEQLDLTPSALEQLRQDFWSGDLLDGRLLEFIRHLRPRYRTGLLSNAWSETRQQLESNWRIADLFDAIVISAEVKIAKPDARIYQLILDQLQVAPAQAIFIDDFQDNIDAAARLGMHTVHFQSTERALSRISELLTSEPPVRSA